MKKALLPILFLIACSEQSEKADINTQPPSVTANRLATGLAWSKPDGWIAEKPASSMRKAQFRLSKAESDPEDATVIIFYFQGGGGGVRANIERWISQFKEAGEQARAVADEEKIEVNGLPQTLVDITGTYLFKTRPMAPTATEKPGFRMLGAVIEANSGPWFVKFVGPEKTVAKWEKSFRQFLASFKQS